MQTFFIKKEFSYTGSQLRPLFAYQECGVLGDSVVAWVGPCHVDQANMVDFEDLIKGEKIQGDKMLHFIFEIFDRELASGVLLQRLFAGSVKDYFFQQNIFLNRCGDDLYWGDKKLSISIASISSVSVQVHFAMNLTNQGTPVPTAALIDDFAITEPIDSLAQKLMDSFSAEWLDIIKATRKVTPL